MKKYKYKCNSCGESPCFLEVIGSNLTPSICCLSNENEISWQLIEDEEERINLSERITANENRIQEIENSLLTKSVIIKHQYFNCPECNEKFTKEDLIDYFCPSCQERIANDDYNIMEEIEKHYNNGGYIQLDGDPYLYCKNRKRSQLKFDSSINLYKIIFTD